MTAPDFSGKVAIVTGAGSGVGRRTALALAERGAVLAICDVHEANLRQTAEDIGRIGGEVLFLRTDISREEDVRRFYVEVEARYGRADILVNCAAVWDQAEIGDIDGSRFDRIIAINLKGTFLMCKEAFALMRKTRTGGAIVNIASTAGEFGSIRPAAHYAASKGGVIAFSKSLAREGAPDNIRVNVVSPGPIDTPMSQIYSEEQRRALSERTLLGRVGTAEDISNAVLYLVSPVSSWVTGEVLRVNGGSLI